MAKTKALVNTTGFSPILNLLVQALDERWWDTTHTFHIAGREMTVTPHEFHRMTGLRFDGPIINLESDSGI